MEILGGSKNQKSGKCHELSRKSIIFLDPPHPGGPGVGGGALGVNISKVREISRTAEKINNKIVTPTPPDGVGWGGYGLKCQSIKF